MILDPCYFFIFDIGMNQKDVKKTADIWKIGERASFINGVSVRGD